MFDKIVCDLTSVKADKQFLEYKIIIPGVSKENIIISITNKKLFVKTKEKTAFGELYQFQDEWNYDKYFEVSKAKANLQDGVLTILIPRKQEQIEKENIINIE